MVQLFRVKITVFSCLLFLVFGNGYSQNNKQVVRGRVLDKESNAPLPGALIRWVNEKDQTHAAACDGEGYFNLFQIPIGRQDFEVSMLGYKSFLIPDVIVTSGKEVRMCRKYLAIRKVKV